MSDDIRTDTQVINLRDVESHRLIAYSSQRQPKLLLSLSKYRYGVGLPALAYPAKKNRVSAESYYTLSFLPCHHIYLEWWANMALA
ncbi:hypothetical protein [Coleofasciculus chthonoplastes]|uniref:hypothetical protein n=1 Tax=Coleofasciculus chthonoplastes TaxID=64178 RepID=UPI003302C881